MPRRRMSYICVMAVATVQLAYIKTLVNNYIDLRLSAMQLQDEAMDCLSKDDTPSMTEIGNKSYKEIPVNLCKKRGVEYAKVSEEDYERVVSFSKKWKKSTTGYAIWVKRNKDTRKFETTYMHKFVHGNSAKHLNGDRLDNRRENLVRTINRANGIYNKGSMDTSDFILFTPRVLCEDIHKFRWTEKELNEFSGYADVEYNNGKFFSGDIQKGKPHGYGHLFEEELNTQCCGEWKNGIMKNGMIITYKPYPKCICDYMKHCPVQEVKNVGVVKNGYRL